MRQLDPMYIHNFDGDVVSLADTSAHDLRAATTNDPQIVRVLSVLNKETTAQTVKVGIHDGTTTVYATIEVPLSAGNVTGTALFDLLGASELAAFVETDGGSNPMIVLPAGWKMTIQRTGSNTSGMIAISKAEIWGDGTAAS